MKLNRILAAALVAAAAGPAIASIALPADGPTGNGELFLVVWDGTDQVSYTKDLGIFMDDFTGNASLPAFALNDAFFTSFLAVADNGGAADFSDLKFAVIAGDGVGQKRLFSTIDALITPYNNGNLNSGTGYLTLYQGAQDTQSANTSHPGGVAVNGTSFDLVPNVANFLTADGPSYSNSIQGGTWTNSNFINTPSVFRSFTQGPGLGGGQTVKSDFGFGPLTLGGFWNVTNANGVWQASYSVTPIPEADGVAMMLAGFSAFAFVARRRRPR